MTKSALVTKSNSLIDANYKLNVQAQKLILACLSKIDPRIEIPREITISASEFSSLMHVDIKNAHRELYKAADILFRSEITLYENGEKIELYWIQEKAQKVTGEGVVRLMWSERILKYISQIKSHFTTYKIQNIAKLQSSHSIRIYELLMRFKSTEDRVIYLEDFKASLGIADKYSKFKHLNNDVIKPSINELNKRTDLIIKYETIKKGRSVAALSFRFTQKKTIKT